MRRTFHESIQSGTTLPSGHKARSPRAYVSGPAAFCAAAESVTMSYCCAVLHACHGLVVQQPPGCLTRTVWFAAGEAAGCCITWATPSSGRSRTVPLQGDNIHATWRLAASPTSSMATSFWPAVRWGRSLQGDDGHINSCIRSSMRRSLAAHCQKYMWMCALPCVMWACRRRAAGLFQFFMLQCPE